MNTKKLFMLLAAMLLGSVSAFAQSGNNEPLKGDVNEDGTVDVADIVDVIKILKDAGGAVGERMGYWYAGTNNGNAVTADNFTDVASRIPENEIPETGSVTANGQYIYFVMPETRHVESLTYANGSAVEFTCTDVMGYHIYKTSEIINTTINYTIKQTIYYWYIGLDNPAEMTTTSPLAPSGTFLHIDYEAYYPGWRLIGPTIPTYGASNILWDGGNKDIVFEERNYYYIALPTIALSIYDSVGGSAAESYEAPVIKLINGVSYYIYKSNYKARAFGYVIY